MKSYDAGVIGIAVIWAIVIFAASLILKDTEFLSDMLIILGGGAAGCLIILGGARKNTNKQ